MSRRPFKARSADGPMMFSALEMHYPETQRIAQDPLAIQMLSPLVRLAARSMAWRPLRQLMARSLDKQMPGLWGGMVARKRYADDQVAEALASGITQFVILGAGFDTRALRLIAPAGARAFEVDLPDNVLRKKAALRRLSDALPERVALVAADFECVDLMDSLAAHGFRTEAPTMYIMEAVTQYLTEDAIDRVFTALSETPPSSRLIFTYIRQDFLDGKRMYGWDKAYKQWVIDDQVWRFGLAPTEVGSFLRKYGWTARDQLGPTEYRTRYFKPAGRDLDAFDIELFVSADRRTTP